MDDITEVKVLPLEKTQFVSPLTLHYKQNGIEKTWDLIKVHNSVAVIIFNISRKVLVLVRQFRPAAYYAAIPDCDKQQSIDTSKYPGSQGLMLELCAGIVDKDKSLEEIAREEVLEECGYDVPAASFKKIVSLRSSVGVCGDRQTIFYVEVLDSQRILAGGGNSAEGEYIEVVEMTPTEAQDYLTSGDTLSPGGCLFGLQWFLSNKLGK